jgi:hypothetical protein
MCEVCKWMLEVEKAAGDRDKWKKLCKVLKDIRPAGGDGSLKTKHYGS